MSAVTNALAHVHAAETRGHRGTEIAVADLRGLIDIIAELCDDHETCESCGTVLCTACEIGDVAACESVPTFVHCDNPDCACKACAITIGEDSRAEAYADATGGRY